MSSSDLQKRIAFVTGASQGIGKSIAIRLAQDGLDVAINDIPSKETQLQEVSSKITKNGVRSLVITGDVSKETEVKNMIERVVAELGGLDVMVANAGVGSPRALVVDTPTEVIERVLNVNLWGVFWSYKYAAIQMIQQGRGGRIIGASSILGKQGVPMLSGYVMSKFAVRGLTMSMAQELQEHNITVNAYAPGLTRTGMITLTSEDMKYGGNPGDSLRAAAGLPANMPLIEPEDVAATVSFLAKSESRYINGQTFSVTGTTWAD